MNALTDFLSSPVADRIGLTLLHSVWQLTLVAVIVFLILKSLHRFPPNVRYLVSCAALLLMVVIPVLTFASLQVDEWARPRLTMSMSEAAMPVMGDDLTAAVIETRIPLPAAKGEAGLQLPTAPPSSAISFPNTPLVQENTDSTVVDTPAEAASDKVTKELASGQTHFSLLESLSKSLVPWSPWITFVWLIGFAVITIRNVGGWQATRRLRCLSMDVDHPRAHALLRELSQRLGIRGEVRLRESELVRTPIVFGWLKPIVLTPIGLLTQLTNDQLEALLAHELGHVRRHDYLCNGLQTLAESVLFFHPAVWWLSRRIRLEREYCCDDLAVKLCGNRVVYAETLATIEESLGTIGLGVSAGEKPLLKRVRRVLGLNPKPRSQFSLFGIWGASLLVAVSLGFVLVSRQGVGEEPITVMAASESTAEVTVVDDKPENEIPCYQQLSDLENEIQKLLKSGRIEDAEKRILDELPAISNAWLSDDYNSLALSKAKSLQKTIRQDSRLSSNFDEEDTRHRSGRGKNGSDVRHHWRQGQRENAL